MSRTPPGICMLATKFYATSDMGGGLERSARRLFAHLLAEGHRVFVLTRNYDGLPAREIIEGVEVHRFPVWGRSRVMASLSYLAQSLWWLCRSRRDYQIIHCHQSYAPAMIGVLAKRLLGKPVVVKVSTADAFSERRILERLPGFRVRRLLLRRVDRFVMVNARAREEFAGLGIDAVRMIHIPNGVSIPQERACDPRTRQAARDRLGMAWTQIALFVGRLCAEKNLGTLIEAWPLILAAHPQAHLMLVGDGGTFRSVEPTLRRQVRAGALDASVHFAGRVDDVTGFFLAADLFVLPSSTEGMSNALLEAMAAGLPIVATRIPGNTALIREGAHGLLVDPLDAEGLAGAISRVLASPDMAARMGRSARRAVEEQCAIARIGRRYERLYGELLHPRGPCS